MTRLRPMAPIAQMTGLIELFVGGASRNKLQAELRAHHWTWSTPTDRGSRLLTVLLEERWRRLEFENTRGDASGFHAALCEVIATWPAGAERHRAQALLALVALAQGASDGQELLAPLQAGPFLPQALAVVPDSPGVVVEKALFGWVGRMGQAPDPRWVAHWADTTRHPAGLRAPALRAPFFQREFGAKTPDGLAGWCVVPWLHPSNASELVHRLHELAPPRTHGAWYAAPEASSAYLRLVAAINLIWQPRSRSGAEDVMGPAWDSGWRPLPPAHDPEGWARLRQVQPAWEAWLSARLLSEALPSASTPTRLRL